MDSLLELGNIQVSKYHRKMLNSIQPFHGHPQQSSADDLDLKTISEGGHAAVSSCHHHSGICRENKPVGDSSYDELYSKMKEAEDKLHSKTLLVTELEEKVAELKQTIGGGGECVSESATHKIIELSRKNRDLHSELGKGRNRIRQLQKQLAKHNEEAIKHQNTEEEIDHPTQEQMLRDKVVSLEEQLNHCKRKMAEHSNQCQKLKQDLKLAHKILVQEVGEGVTINSLSVDGVGWKGRAQQILNLQNKVNELQRRLATGSARTRKYPSSSCASMANSGATKQQHHIDDKHKASVYKIEKENKQRYQDVKVELDKLRDDYESLKQQCSALRARNKILTQECKERRQEAQVNKTPTNFHKLSPNHDLTGCKDLEPVVKDLQLKLTASEDERTKLQHIIVKLRENQIKLTSQGNNSRGGANNDENRVNTLPPIKMKSIKQQSCYASMARVSAPTRNSISAGQQPSTIMPQQHYHRQFIGANYDDICAKYRVVEIERDRVMGLADLLQKRLDKAEDDMMKLQCDLNIARQESRSKDNNGGSGGIKNAKLSSLLSAPGRQPETIDQLHENLLLLKDENDVLRSNLLMVRQQRQDERKQFHSVMEETKQIFSEALKHFETK